jgi:hypothetical protein
MTKINRRRLLAGTGAALVLPSLPVAPFGSLARASQPAPPDRLAVAQGAEPATLHPLLETGMVEASAYYGNPEIDPLAAQAAAEMAPNCRLALYGRILATLRADVSALWLAQLDVLYAVRPSVDWQPREDSLVWLRGSTSPSS